MNEVLIYQKDDGQTAVEVRLEQDTLWMSQAQMAELFDKDSDTIGLHLRNIYESGELNEDATTEESSVVRQEGKRQVRRTICFYNLDAVISVGYRVNSVRCISSSRIIRFPTATNGSALFCSSGSCSATSTI